MKPKPYDNFTITLTTGQPVTCTRETIGPSLARTYLQTNLTNRKPRPRQVEILKRDLLAGAWRFTHQGVAFDASGNLMDGQHRLMAIIAADISIPDILVWRGIPAEAKEATDQSQGRTLAENLQLIDGEKNTASLCSLVNAIVRCWTFYDFRLSLPQTREILALFPLLRKVAAVDSRSVPPPFAVPAVRACCGIALHRWPQEAAAFHDSYQKGLNLSADSPAHHLRNFCLNSEIKGSKIAKTLFAYTADCLERHIAGRPMSLSKPTGTGREWLRQAMPKEYAALRQILKLV